MCFSKLEYNRKKYFSIQKIETLKYLDSLHTFQVLISYNLDDYGLLCSPNQIINSNLRTGFLSVVGGLTLFQYAPQSWRRLLTWWMSRRWSFIMFHKQQILVPPWKDCPFMNVEDIRMEWTASGFRASRVTKHRCTQNMGKDEQSLNLRQCQRCFKDRLDWLIVSPKSSFQMNVSHCIQFGNGRP